jgi:Arc/MetJ-type ribon-helix-helix transcriptional regulator
MRRGKVVKGTARVVHLRLGVRNITFRTTERVEDVLAYLVAKGYFMNTSEAVRFAILYLYFTVRQLEEGGPRQPS